MELLQAFPPFLGAYTEKLILEGIILILVICLVVLIFRTYHRSSSESEKKLRSFDSVKSNVDKLSNELENIQQKLIAQQNIVTLGTLAAGIAHEIKNPLNFIQNFSNVSLELLEELQELIRQQNESPTTSEIREIMVSLSSNMKKISEHSIRANSIVHSMLAHARGQAEEKKEVSVKEILEEAIKLSYHGMRAYDATFNVKFEKDYDPAIILAKVTPGAFTRVFLNLLNNSYYSTQQKKKELGSSYEPLVRVTTREKDGEIQIIVYDNGKGIAQDNLNKLFVPFFTTKPMDQGTGLGLSICREIIVEGHKGKIDVSTKEGEFAEFIITLPKKT